MKATQRGRLLYGISALLCYSRFVSVRRRSFLNLPLWVAKRNRGY